MKSPLKQVIGLGAAHEGPSHWWQQRVTAVALVPLGLWFALTLPGLELGSHAAVVAWIGAPLNAILLVLTASCLIYHSWLGVGVVLEDYIGHSGVKLVALLLSSFAHAFAFAVCVFSILKLAVRVV
jgi:succinate dehydrogenase / fumarate reductase membrane anchor subunit